MYWLSIKLKCFDLSKRNHFDGIKSIHENLGYVHVVQGFCRRMGRPLEFFKKPTKIFIPFLLTSVFKMWYLEFLETALFPNNRFYCFSSDYFSKLSRYLRNFGKFIVFIKIHQYIARNLRLSFEIAIQVLNSSKIVGSFKKYIFWCCRGRGFSSRFQTQKGVWLQGSEQTSNLRILGRYQCFSILVSVLTLHLIPPPSLEICI